MDYISREAAKRIVDEINTRLTSWRDYAKLQMNAIPAADVVPVRHGRWRKAKTFDIDRAYECSICGDTPFYDEIEKFNYCRRCGADMQGCPDRDTAKAQYCNGYPCSKCGR